MKLSSECTDGDKVRWRKTEETATKPDFVKTVEISLSSLQCYSVLSDILVKNKL